MNRTFSYPPPLMDKTTLARHLCISTDTIDARVEAGLLPAGKMWGGKLVWIWDEVWESVRARLGSSENDLAAKVRHATRKAVNDLR